MREHRIASLLRRGRGFDLETDKIQPGLISPPIVCGSVASYYPPNPDLDPHRPPGDHYDHEKLDLDRVRSTVDQLLEPDAQEIIVGANIGGFDLLCLAVDYARRGVDLMPRIFRAYGWDGVTSQSVVAPDGRVWDVPTAEALNAIADGNLLKDPRTGGKLKDPETGKDAGYRLNVCVDLLFGEKTAKANDRFRTSYALLRDIPMSDWPEDALAYLGDDAINPLRCALAQAGHVPRLSPHDWVHVPGADSSSAGDFVCSRCKIKLSERGESRGCPEVRTHRNLHALADESMNAWCLGLGAAWGLRVDGKALDELEAAAMVGRTRNADTFVKLGYVRSDGTEDQAFVKKAVCHAYAPDGLPACTACAGVGKVPSPKRGPKYPIVCSRCSGTGFELEGSGVPMTEPSSKFPIGTVQIGRDILVESGNEDLVDYAASQEDDKVIDTYVPRLREGGIDCPRTLRPNNPLETLRVSYQGIEQLLPRLLSAGLLTELKSRGSKLLGVRDCIVPRAGWFFFSNDAKGGELVTFSTAAKRRVGFSRMGEALSRGIDVHSALAATWLGVSYDYFLEMLAGKHGPEKKSIAKRFRQAAKPENFGNPGGMGPAKKTITQRKQGPDTPHPNGPSLVDDGNGNLVQGYKGLRYCILVAGAERCGEVKVTSWNDRPIAPTCRKCIEIAAAGRDAWFRQWPEARPYLDWHGHNVDEVGEIDVPGYGVIRGGADFCAEANGDFQSLLAVVMKTALRRVVTESYVRCRVESSEHARGPSAFEGLESPLYNVCRPIVFAHDEIFGECREDVAHEVSVRVNEIIVEEFRRRCPEFRDACDAEPTIMPRWWKAAAPMYHADRLVPWTPEHAKDAAEGKCAGCEDQKARNKARAASVVKA